MKRRAAEPADDQNGREHRRDVARPTRLSTRDRDDGADHHQEPGPPAIRQVAEADLRHRRRQLKQHRQRSGGREVRSEPRDEQRQQRRVDVAVAVDHHVRARHQQNGGMEVERGAGHDRMPRRSSRAAPARAPRRTLRCGARGAAAASTTSADADGRDDADAAHGELRPGSATRAPVPCQPRGRPMSSDATVIFDERDRDAAGPRGRRGAGAAARAGAPALNDRGEGRAEREAAGSPARAPA